MAAKNFDACMKEILQYEGGYVNHPKDPGGPTNYGITIATLAHELGRKVTAIEVKNMDIRIAMAIYRKKYWNLIDGDNLPDGVDLMAFDIAVNSGPGRALRWLAKCKNMKPAEQIKFLHTTRMAFWQSLPTWATFKNGWTHRGVSCFIKAKQLRGLK